MADRNVESDELGVPQIDETLEILLLQAIEEAQDRMEAGSEVVPFTALLNGETVTGEKGVYTVKNVTTDLVITVEGATKKVLKPVTVYFSFSHDDTFESCNESGETMALKEVTVPYFDLELYGLENFYFASENYGPASGDPTGGPGSALDPGTKEFAYGKVTMFHLFIYATEVYYLGIDPADAEIIYRQVVEQTAANDEMDDYVKAYSSMKPKEAAAIFDTMTDNLQLVADILDSMDAQSRANILGKMDAATAAKVTAIMEPVE